MIGKPEWFSQSGPRSTPRHTQVMTADSSSEDLGFTLIPPPDVEGIDLSLYDKGRERLLRLLNSRRPRP